MGFFKSFFSGKSDSPANEKQKNEQKNFEIFKYDGMRCLLYTSYAVVLYAKSDKATLHKRIPGTFPEKEYIKEVYEHLHYYYQMAMGDGQGCVREFNIEDFCRKFKYFPVPVRCV